MALMTKCIYHEPEPNDGTRVCVMGRLTENDGKTPVKALVYGLRFDYWAKIFAPPPKLVGAWYRKELDWSEFISTYSAHLKEPKINPHVRALAQMAFESDITILCVEESHEQCHRSILAEMCHTYEPSLYVVHR